MSRFQFIFPGAFASKAAMLRPKHGFLPSLTFVLVISISTAWSYEGRYMAYDPSNVSRETLYSNPASTDVDTCTSLLSSFQTTPSRSASDGNQRTAGKIAALGIILGARFALAPVRENVEMASEDNAKTPIHTQGNEAMQRSAQAIADYRHCLKTQALSHRIAMN